MSLIAAPSRTLIIPVDARVNVTDLDGYWPVARSGDLLNYGLDLTAPMVENGELIANVSVDIAPSGAGALAVSAVDVSGSRIVSQLGGGKIGQLYRVRHTVVGTLGSQRQWIIGLWLGPTVTPPLDTSSNNYGTAISWALFGSLSLADGRISSWLTILGGL